MKIRKVKWRDSRMYINQIEKESTFEIAILTSVGFVIKDTKDFLVLAGDLLEDDIRRTIVIPKENIIS